MPAVNCEFLNRPKSLMKDLPISTVCFVSKIQYPCTWLMNIDYRHSNWHKIMVGEYLMVFQNNTCNKFTIAQNWTLFFHQWLSGDIGYSSVQALHSRLASCECARFRLPTFWPFQKKIFKTCFFTFDVGVPFSINFLSPIRASEASRESERRSREVPLPVSRFWVSSRVPLVRLLFTISPKGRACSQAKNLWNKTPCPLRLVSFVDWNISKHMWDLIFWHNNFIRNVFFFVR